MATRAANILSSVRYTLGDLNGDRWSDIRLLQLLSEGQRDIVRHTNLLRTYGQITTADFTDLSIYDAPDNFVKLTRATCDNKVLKIVSSDWMDTHYEGWEDFESDSASPTHIVFDDLNQGKLRVYPKPKTLGSNYEFQVFTWIDPAGSIDPNDVVTTSDVNYGALVDIQDDSGLSTFDFFYYKEDGTLVSGRYNLRGRA